MNRKKLITILISLIFGIFLVNFMANKFYWYSSIWYFDMIMHFLGGLWIGLASIYLFKISDKSVNTIFRVMLSVLLVGIAWEIYEIAVNDVLAQNTFNYLDTISDIFFDLGGGSTAILYFFTKIMIVNENNVQLENA